MRLQEAQTPIIDALIQHVQNEKVSLHVPGHHQGRLMPARLAPWLGQATKLDVTELPGLDNLHDATGCIEASQHNAALHYGSRKCFYSVNGATACVMAAIRSCVTGRNRTVVLLGPCHLSAWRGLVYADAVPRFVSSRWRTDLNLFDVPSVDSLAHVLENENDIAGVFLTSPTYQGLVAPVEALSDVAHRYGVPLIVDEAHGAHFGLHPKLPKHSVACGADLVIQSPHKTLPCLTQAAWLHVAGNLIHADDIREHLNFLQTTSPSYLLLAALDGAQAWLRGEGQAVADTTLAFLDRLRSVPNYPTDPMRFWIPTQSAKQIEQLRESLADAGVCLEYTDASGALAMFGFGQPAWEYEQFFRIVDTWQQTVQSEMSDDQSLTEVYHMQADVCAVLKPLAVSRTRGRKLSLSGSVGEILRQPIAPYPPGVPVLWPGQRVEQYHVETLQRFLLKGGKLGGIDENGYVEVCDDDETRVFHHV